MATERALDAFEARLKPILKHKLFCGWAPCSLQRSTAEEWAEIWDMDELLEEEREAMRDRLIGKLASANRRGGFTLLTHAYANATGDDDESVRPAMCALADTEVEREALFWCRVQTRQAFRLALESLFEWIIQEIDGGTQNTQALAQRLLAAIGGTSGANAEAWFTALVPENPSAVEAMEALQSCFATGEGLEAATFAALAIAVLSDPKLHDQSRRRERLPIAQAAADLHRLRDETPERLLEHVIEHWIIAQHTYWSVGRGLADARAGAKPIMRLRLVLEPDGWRVTRGRGSRGMPRPTPDRLRTAISLAQECGLLPA